MKNTMIVTLAAIATLGLAACSEKAQNEMSEAGDAVAADTQTTMNEAVSDVDAAFESATNRIDTVADSVGNSADDLGNAVDEE